MGAETTLGLAFAPSGALHLDHASEEVDALPEPIAARIALAFAGGVGAGLAHLGSVELDTPGLPASLAFGRTLARTFYGELTKLGDVEVRASELALALAQDAAAALLAGAPPMRGAEYVSESALRSAWEALLEETRRELAHHEGGLGAFLHAKSPVYHAVGRVCFHLAENKRDAAKPFAFLATYSTRVSSDGKLQHAPLGQAVRARAEARERELLLALLEPVRRAAATSALVRELVDSGDVFHPLAWDAQRAYRFLREVPALEAAGVVVRVPDFWRARTARRPRVAATIGGASPVRVGAGELLDFDVAVTIDGEPLSAEEREELLAGSAGLRLLRGRWVEVDPQKLAELLGHWEHAKAAAQEGLSFAKAMRLLAGMPDATLAIESDADEEVAWHAVNAGPWLRELLAELTQPSRIAGDAVPQLQGTLRGYQRDGVAWMGLLAGLGLGACLADDMGLGKTVQVLALLLSCKHAGGTPGPHLIVVPTSLLANWRSEASRFAPSLRLLVAHTSAMPAAALRDRPALDGVDVVVTTYGTAARLAWLGEIEWGLAILDEAQAIKNPATQQARALKRVRSKARVAMTGTPVENRVGDLYSLFDFLCPGLLGSARSFREHVKGMQARSRYEPLRRVLAPYILRRLKSDPRVAPDLPDKTEVRAFCGLSKRQAALYEQAVGELADKLDTLEGIERSGVVLATLTRLKQICNHPAHWLDDHRWDASESAKVERLLELCEPIAARQEKVLVFTQFREIIEPLARWLEGAFGRPGAVLHGGTTVKKRGELVAEFQREEGPPFFVLSLKAGGTGLNLTAASHVIHFDRWWNPAVETQATDRAYRIGQKRNVLVHPMICRGTVEERVDALIESKRSLAEQVVASSGESWIAELDGEALLALVSLDLGSAVAQS